MEKMPFTIDEIKQDMKIQEKIIKEINENKMELCPITLEEESIPGFSRTLFKATYYVGYCKSGVFQVSLIRDFFGAYPSYVHFESITQVGKTIIDKMEKQTEEVRNTLIELQQTIFKLGYEQLWVHQRKGTQSFQLALAKCKKGKKPEEFLKEKEYAKIDKETYLIALKEGIYEARFKKDTFKEIKDLSQKRAYVKKTYNNARKKQVELENQVKNIRFLLEKNKVRSLFLT